MRGLGICPAPDTFGKERRSKTYVAQALNRQKHQTSHPKRPRFVQIHADTPLFSPTSENPAKQTGITKQTTIQTRNQKTAHKNPKKHRITHNTNRTETTRKKPPNSKKPTEQQTSPAGKKYVNEKKVYGGKPCAYAHVRITLVRSENNFFSKKSFSPEENFSQKILLYYL